MGDAANIIFFLFSIVRHFIFLPIRMEQNTSRYRIRTELPPFAGLAVFADPYIVELAHRLLHDFGLIGEDASLKVSLAIGFHADARPGEVCAADIDLLAVEDYQLEVDTRTKHSFQPIEQDGILVDVFSESWTRLFRMNKANLNATLDKLGDERKKRFLFFSHFHIEVLDVCSADPEGVLNGDHTSEDGGVVGGVGDVLEHNAKSLFSPFLKFVKKISIYLVRIFFRR